VRVDDEGRLTAAADLHDSFMATSWVDWLTTTDPYA
jgi:hypothetical protein